MRVASLLPSATELLFAVGAGAEVVARSHECDFPPQAGAVPAVTGNALALDGLSAGEIDRHISRAVHDGSSIYVLDEALLAGVRPDLVVTQELCEVCAVAYVRVNAAVRRLDRDIRILSLEPGSLEDILGTALAVGEATGHIGGARRLVADLRGRIDAVRRAPHVAPGPPRVACIEWTEPLMAGGHWVPEMVALAGGADVLGVAGQPSRRVEWERVRGAEPDVMVLMPCGFDVERSLAGAADVVGRPGFAGLPCARTGRVVAVDGSSYFNRPGPRIVDGLEILAAVLRARPGDPLPAGARWVPATWRD